MNDSSVYKVFLVRLAIFASFILVFVSVIVFLIQLHNQPQLLTSPSNNVNISYLGRSILVHTYTPQNNPAGAYNIYTIDVTLKFENDTKIAVQLTPANFTINTNNQSAIASSIKSGNIVAASTTSTVVIEYVVNRKLTYPIQIGLVNISGSNQQSFSIDN